MDLKMAAISGRYAWQCVRDRTHIPALKGALICLRKTLIINSLSIKMFPVALFLLNSKNFSNVLSVIPQEHFAPKYHFGIKADFNGISQHRLPPTLLWILSEMGVVAEA